MKRLLAFLFGEPEDTKCAWVFCEEPRAVGWHYCDKHMELYHRGRRT